MLIFEATHAYSATMGGKIYDKETKEPLIFTPIGLYTLEKKLVAVAESDIEGNYLFEDVQEGNYYIWAAFIGYSESEVDFSVKQKDNLKINIELEESTIFVGELVSCYCGISALPGIDSRIDCSFNDEDIQTDIDVTADSLLDQELSLILFPIPTSSNLYVKTNHPIKQLFIFSYDGKLLIHQRPNTDLVEIDISTLPKGAYFLHVGEDGSEIQKQFIKF